MPDERDYTFEVHGVMLEEGAYLSEERNYRPGERGFMAK